MVPYWVSRTPEAFYELLARTEVTVLNQTPSAFRQLLQTDAFAEDRKRLVLRLVIFGGEALDPQSLRPWFDRHGEVYPLSGEHVWDYGNDCACDDVQSGCCAACGERKHHRAPD